MRNTSRLAAIFVLTGTTHSFSAVAAESAPTSPAPTAANPGSPAAPCMGPAPEAAPSSGAAAAPSRAAQVPVEDAAGSYAPPGSAESTTSDGSPANATTSPSASQPTPSKTPPTRAAPDTDGGAEAEPMIPLARDTVGGHLAVGAIGGLAVPFGSADSSAKMSDLAGAGLYLGGDITYGVSRTVMMGAYGEVAMPAGESCACRPSWSSSQSVSAVAAGPLLRYHLVQGTRFDPWLSYGFGFRRISSGSDSFTGVDWARLQLGGDWYPSSAFGLGPVLEMSLGTFFGSSGALESKTVNAQFALGLRVVFDSPGK